MKGVVEKDGKILYLEVKDCETDKECNVMLAEGWDLITVVSRGDEGPYSIRYIIGRYIQMSETEIEEKRKRQEKAANFSPFTIFGQEPESEE